MEEVGGGEKRRSWRDGGGEMEVGGGWRDGGGGGGEMEVGEVERWRWGGGGDVATYLCSLAIA